MVAGGVDVARADEGDGEEVLQRAVFGVSGEPGLGPRDRSIRLSSRQRGARFRRVEQRIRVVEMIAR